jgi:dTDP-4-dehydrorhamnose reductase
MPEAFRRSKRISAAISTEMIPTILLTGKNGQVGRELAAMLPAVGNVVAVGRDELDLSKPDDIRNLIRKINPQLIVNAAAYTAVDKAESEESLASAINAEAAGIMAEEAKKIGAALVHYSTDYIFAGLKTTPYNENDAPNPQSVYGRTKLQGEKAIQRADVDHLIFRTAWVYGREGKNFLLTILRLATQREELRIVSDQIGAPTSSHEIAAATTKILTQLFSHDKRKHPLSKVSGTYHMTAAGETSWAGFAEAILDHARTHPPSAPWYASATNNLPIIAKRVAHLTTAEYPTPARRPAYSVLSNRGLADTFQTHLPDWRTQLRNIFATS